MDKVQIIFMRWASEVKEEGVHRFLYKGRRERIDMLVQYLFEAGIELDDAQILKNKIGPILVTKEGFKGQGKYKDWLKNVHDDFLESLANTYGDQILAKPPVYNAKMLPKSSVITEWCKYTYGSLFNDQIEEEARTYGSPIFLKMIREFETE